MDIAKIKDLKEYRAAKLLIKELDEQAFIDLESKRDKLCDKAIITINENSYQDLIDNN